MAASVSYRITVVLLWALAALDAAVCQGLFWDGSAFLARIIETGTFHDFYPARAHIAYLTQWPLLLLIEAGVRDVHLLAIVFSAMLFGIPAALYHLALARVRDRGALLAAMIAIVALVYLPTSFFIVGEYNIAYAAVTAAFALALTGGGSLLLLALGLLCIASYEAMIYLGPITAAVILWSARGRHDVMAMAAALAFLGAAVVAGATTVEYWNHPHFALVRAAALDFWQNLQFVVPLAGLALIALLALVRPSGLASRAPLVLAAVVGLVLMATPLFRLILVPESMVFPPSHYVARSAAGGLLAGLLLASWLYVAWPKAPLRLIAVLHRPIVAQRLSTAMVMLLLAGLVPDLTLTKLWVDHLAWFRGMVTSQQGLVRADPQWMGQWPHRLFSQEWTYPALSVLLRTAPGQAVIVAANDYRNDFPFDPACGTVPRLDGYVWR